MDLSPVTPGENGSSIRFTGTKRAQGELLDRESMECEKNCVLEIFYSNRSIESSRDFRTYPREVQLAASQGARMTACVANSSAFGVGFSCAIRATASNRSLSCRRSGSSLA